MLCNDIRFFLRLNSVSFLLRRSSFGMMLPIVAAHLAIDIRVFLLWGDKMGWGGGIGWDETMGYDEGWDGVGWNGMALVA